MVIFAVARLTRAVEPDNLMRLCFLIYAYFPYGGQQRDFASIVQECQRRGHEIDVYCLRWQGEVFPGINRTFVPVRALTNIGLYRRYTDWVATALAKTPPDVTIGFSSMPLLDIQFAADICFAEKAEHHRGFYYRFTSRYRHFSAYEKAVFGSDSKTQIMVLSPRQQTAFTTYYPRCANRLHLMPPGINADRLVTAAHRQEGAALRAEYGVAENDFMLLQVGSGFRVKGVDRSLRALAALPDTLRQRCRYLLIGQDKPARYLRLAHRLGVSNNVTVLPGRDDVPRFLAAADILLHPAYMESAGYIILEAIIAGLPVLTTATCGYAPRVETANAGLVCQNPFNQQELNEKLHHMLETLPNSNWSSNGIEYGKQPELYSLPSAAADLIEATKA
ncbi:MAG: glycosyltransferase family 4 protein [Pseudomonadales bacterium]